MDEQKVERRMGNLSYRQEFVLSSHPSIINGQDLIYNTVDLSEHIILVSFLLNSDVGVSKLRTEL